MHQFIEVSLILLVALIVSTLMRYLKQPLVIGYILTGILVGPYALNILQSVETVELFSKLGITALLFVVGLGLSPKVLKELGVVATITGLGQVIFTSGIGYIIGLALGFSPLESVYIAVALTFSSTIIILKLLSDKGDVHKLYGKIAIGFLLVQDLVATIALVGISSLTSVNPEASVYVELGIVLGKGLILLVLIMIVSTYILPKLTNFLAASQEYLFIASLAWGMSIAALYYYFGLSVEIGALVAGVALSMAPYVQEVASRLRPLRDFFIILFFILLGSQMVLSNFSNLLTPTILFSAFILIGNPLIVFILLNLMGYTKKTGFMAGLTVAQISEFSLILVKLGFDVGHLSEEILSMVTLVGILTISGSTYLILYSDQIYKKLHKILGYLEFRKVRRKAEKEQHFADAFIFGYKRAGPEFAHVFRELNVQFKVVDFNPETITRLSTLGVNTEYGDASDVEFLAELPMEDVKYVVSTIPDVDTNILLVQAVRRVNQNAIVIIVTDTITHAANLYNSGATYVVLAHYIGAHLAAEMIKKHGSDPKNYESIREDHIKYMLKVNDLTFQL